MSLFSDYVSKRRTTQAPDDVYQLDQQRPRTVQTQQQPAESSDPGGYKAAPHGTFPQDYWKDGWGLTTPMANEAREKAVRNRNMPQLDSDNPIGDLAKILGPSPEEREAEERRLQEHKQKMHGWTALFNGLRNISNLYFTAKGAAPQTYNNPHAEIEQQYQDERRRLAEIQERNRQYYTNLYTLRRQMENDRWNREQAIQKNEREEAINQAKLELSRAQVARQEALKDGDLMKAKKIEEEIEQMKRMNPLLLKEKQASIEQKKAAASNSRASARRTLRNMDQDEYETVTEEEEDNDGRKTRRTYKRKRNAGGVSLLPGQSDNGGSLLPQ